MAKFKPCKYCGGTGKLKGTTGKYGSIKFMGMEFGNTKPTHAKCEKCRGTGIRMK